MTKKTNTMTNATAAKSIKTTTKTNIKEESDKMAVSKNINKSNTKKSKVKKANQLNESAMASKIERVSADVAIKLLCFIKPSIYQFIFNIKELQNSFIHGIPLDYIEKHHLITTEEDDEKQYKKIIDHILDELSNEYKHCFKNIFECQTDGDVRLFKITSAVALNSIKELSVIAANVNSDYLSYDEIDIALTKVDDFISNFQNDKANNPIDFISIINRMYDIFTGRLTHSKGILMILGGILANYNDNNDVFRTLLIYTSLISLPIVERQGNIIKYNPELFAHFGITDDIGFDNMNARLYPINWDIVMDYLLTNRSSSKTFVATSNAEVKNVFINICDIINTTHIAEFTTPDFIPDIDKPHFDGHLFMVTSEVDWYFNRYIAAGQMHFTEQFKYLLENTNMQNIINNFYTNIKRKYNFELYKTFISRINNRILFTCYNNKISNIVSSRLCLKNNKCHYNYNYSLSLEMDNSIFVDIFNTLKGDKDANYNMVPITPSHAILLLLRTIDIYADTIDLTKFNLDDKKSIENIKLMYIDTCIYLLYGLLSNRISSRWYAKNSLTVDDDNTNVLRSNNAIKLNSDTLIGIIDVFGALRNVICLNGNNKNGNITVAKLYDNIKTFVYRDMNRYIMIPNDQWESKTIQYIYSFFDSIELENYNDDNYNDWQVIHHPKPIKKIIKNIKNFRSQSLNVYTTFPDPSSY